MAIAGVGTAFKRWDGAAYQAVSEINNIDGPGMSRDTIDTTSLDTTGGYRTFITGFRNPGTYTFTMNFTRSEYDTLKTDFEDDALQDYIVVLDDAVNTTFIFKGLVTDIPLSIPPDNKVTIDVTIQISGQVTVQDGEPASPPS